jgi:hypothetical protein
MAKVRDESTSKLRAIPSHRNATSGQTQRRLYVTSWRMGRYESYEVVDAVVNKHEKRWLYKRCH